MNAAGADHWLNAWLAKDKNGNTYMRLSTKLKDDAHKQGMQQAKQSLAPNQSSKMTPLVQAATKKAQALAGVSNEELAKEFGVGNVAVCRWRHKDDMKFSLVVVSHRLNLSLDEFEQLGR